MKIPTMKYLQWHFEIEKYMPYVCGTILFVSVIGVISKRVKITKLGFWILVLANILNLIPIYLVCDLNENKMCKNSIQSILILCLLLHEYKNINDFFNLSIFICYCLMKSSFYISLYFSYLFCWVEFLLLLISALRSFIVFLKFNEDSAQNFFKFLLIILIGSNWYFSANLKGSCYWNGQRDLVTELSFVGLIFVVVLYWFFSRKKIKLN
ncbi:unnamed protein product [Blepharisma stoltei]|uniref:Uncharacterized protein n=1 Tax=Blepharisma stoltei TaxID=1481888 RepID=A0AAU9IKM0_9CILI|nr:unnamed protein product [Blepharisma stoltei]